MVSLGERDHFLLDILSDGEISPLAKWILKLEGGDRTASAYPHAKLLAAVMAGDRGLFEEAIAAYEGRHITPMSVWCSDDSLVFLLLLGCRKFRRDTNLVERILDSRDVNGDGTQRRVSDVFRDILVGSFHVSQPFDYIKVAFNGTLNDDPVTVTTAKTVYQSLTKPGFFQTLMPFQKVLALRAFDIILINRAPTTSESFEEILLRLRQLMSDLSLRQVYQLVKVLPYKWVVFVVMTLAMSWPFVVSVIEALLRDSGK